MVIVKIAEIPEIQAVHGYQTFESSGTTPARHVAPAEIVEVAELPVSATAPVVEVVEAAPVDVQPAHVVEYVTPAPAVTCMAPAPVAGYIDPVSAPVVEAAPVDVQPAHVDEYVAPPPDVAFAAPTPADDYAAPLPEVTDAAPTPVDEYAEQQPSRRRRAKGKRGADSAAPTDLSQMSEQQLATAVEALRQREMMLQSLLEAEAFRLGDLLVQQEQEEVQRAPKRTKRKKR